VNYLRKGGTLLEIIIILAGLAMLVKTFEVGASTYKFVNLSEQADGVVNGTADHGLTLNVQFAAMKGTLYVFTQTGPFFSYQVGDKIPVLYDPDYPANGMVHSAASIWSKPLFFLFIGVALLLVGSHLRYTRNL
jgi:hypothetical protein